MDMPLHIATHKHTTVVFDILQV